MENEETSPTPSNEPTAVTTVLQKGAAPIEALLDKSPSGFKEKLSAKLEDALKKALEQMISTFDDQEVENRLASARAVSDTGTLGLDEERMEIVDEHVSDLRSDVRKKTVVGSALTGTLGVFGQLADLPAFYLYAMRTLGEIAMNYGFDPRTEREQLFILEVLRIGHVPGKKKRLVQIDKLTQVELDAQRDLTKEASYALSGRGLSVAARQIAALLVKRKMGAMIPIVGAVVNAGLNWHLMGNILDTAKRAYRSKATIYRNKIEADK